MPTEIERKFIVPSHGFESLATTHYSIIQGYISRDAGRTIRIRLRTNTDGSEQAYLTIKSNLSHPASPLYESSCGESLKPQFTRFEWEHAISVEDFKQLLPLCGGKVIDKTRYIIPASPAPLKWEIDVFRSPRAGLMLAEIELPTEDAPFERLPFLGEEVTTDPQYYNANML